MNTPSSIIKIDRAHPFDPVNFLGGDWSIAEEDERSLALTEVDLTKVRLETTLRAGETSVKGEERLKRLKKAGYIRLDAKVFRAFWEDKALIPEEWKQKTNGNVTRIYFDGTVLRDPRGDRDVLSLYWRDGQWLWSAYWLGRGWSALSPSAVLASI